MIHLMKLELMKEKFTGTLIALVSIMLFCLGFVVLICYSTLAEDGTFPFTTVQELFLIGDVLYRVCFIVFAGVLIARVVVGEFDTGNARNLFTYPIPRKKLMGCGSGAGDPSGGCSALRHQPSCPALRYAKKISIPDDCGGVHNQHGA